MLSLRRGPLRAIEPGAALAPAVPLPAPTRMPAAPEVSRRALPAAVALDPEERVAVRISVQNLPTFQDGEEPGIALFSANTGADFTWLPLSRSGDGSVLETSTAVVGPVAITLARNRAGARHGYLVRTTHTFSARRGSSAPLVFDAQSHQVTIEVASKRQAGPLRLSRVLDPDWLSSSAAPTGVACRPGHPATLLLGPGEYELTDPIDPNRNQRFTVPSATPVLISDALSRPLAGHL